MRGGLSRAGAGRGTVRLLLPAAACWIFTAIALTFPSIRVGLWAAVCLIALAVLTIFTITVHKSSRSRLYISPNIRTICGVTGIFCAMSLIVLSRMLILDLGRQDPALVQMAKDGSEVLVEGKLTGFPKAKLRGNDVTRWVTMRAESVHMGANEETLARNVAGRPEILVWLDGPVAYDFGPGLSVQVAGRLQFSSPTDMTAFSLSATSVHDLPSTNWDAELGRYIANLRGHLYDAAKQQPGAALVPGFAVGDTSLVLPELQDAMLESSLTHLTAVSGANCALVMSAAVFVASRCRVPRAFRLFITGSTLVLFVSLIGPDASVQRAAAMALVILVGSFGNRRVGGLHALAAAIFTLLILNPWQALQPGFQLSALATGGILTLTKRIEAWFRSAHLPRFIVLPISVSLAAQFACAPALLLLAPGISLVGVPANVAAAPLAPWGTGMGLLAVIFLPSFPAAGNGCVYLATLPARAVEWIAYSAEKIPYGRLEWPDGLAGALALLLLQGFGIYLWALRHGYASVPGIPERAPQHRLWGEKVPLPRRLGGIVAVGTTVVISVVASISVVTPLLSDARVPKDWAVATCDVGQGDAILVRDTSSKHTAMLIDTGDDPVLLNQCLTLFSINQISLLVLTHDDRDHIGALDAVSGLTQTALISPNTEEDGERALIRKLHDARVPFRIAAAGDVGTLQNGDVQITVLQPYPEKKYTDTNEASVVLRIQGPNYSMLALGDTGEAEHQELLRRYSAQTLEVDVLKVAHHGSSDASESLVQTTQARWALISVGADNRYGHPAHKTINALRQGHMRILRTDLYGSIAIVPESNAPVWVETTSGDRVHSSG